MQLQFRLVLMNNQANKSKTQGKSRVKNHKLLEVIHKQDIQGKATYNGQKIVNVKNWNSNTKAW